MEIRITQSDAQFKKLGAPTCNVNYIVNTGGKFPRKMTFNKTYYIYRNNTLSAFRILAYAYISQCYLSYLVQLPNEEPKWIEGFMSQETPIFDSKEQFYSYQMDKNNKVDLAWESGKLVFPEIAYASVIGLRGRVWCWSEAKGRACQYHDPIIQGFLVSKEGVLIYTPRRTDTREYYLSEHECVKANLHYMQVVDFDEEPFEIELNEQPKGKKVHTLRFIED